LSSAPVCGELLILRRSVIRHTQVLIAKQKAIRKAAKRKAGREKDTVQLYERFAQVLRELGDEAGANEAMIAARKAAETGG